MKNEYFHTQGLNFNDNKCTCRQRTVTNILTRVLSLVRNVYKVFELEDLNFKIYFTQVSEWQRLPGWRKIAAAVGRCCMAACFHEERTIVA